MSPMEREFRDVHTTIHADRVLEGHDNLILLAGEVTKKSLSLFSASTPNPLNTIVLTIQKFSGRLDEDNPLD